ncbi:hypothetical protein MHLP_03870 [Candidatus Mycoplasma haematolamae str. Purdue]|uniref:Uncharacterized protein n=1 Tax=Mycoplasma haematolamae (strain Purdue) TaxID=1212765 RepID=I7CKD0_MYCHA|nr:hypothetical protein MHLP_03870 [Candidatus Mycoplasma haematolamae str. Purdue]
MRPSIPLTFDLGYFLLTKIYKLFRFLSRLIVPSLVALGIVLVSSIVIHAKDMVWGSKSKLKRPDTGSSGNINSNLTLSTIPTSLFGSRTLI